MGLDILKKLRNDAKARQKTGKVAEAAPKHPPAQQYFVSSNWKSLLSKKPRISPKAAAASTPVADFGAASNIVAMDCEMVGVGPDGTKSVLARVSIVDNEGKVLLDKFVRPLEFVTDFRTHITGITAATLHRSDIISEVEARKRAAELLDGKVVVGHSIQNDFQVLMLTHPHALIRDTSTYKPLRPPGRESRTPSLKRLVELHLSEQIHGGQHDSVEDARCALRLYRLKSRLWEKQLRSAMAARRPGAPGDPAAGSADAEASDDEGEPVERTPAGGARARREKRKAKVGTGKVAAKSAKSTRAEATGADSSFSRGTRARKRRKKQHVAA
mmetsp:Transcript_20686/g.59924  ORF Transcript_20686/g.59924 Transcript_20686/m.59924 type:complete len:329 (-) Transcript_20686:71-1057(-)